MQFTADQYFRASVERIGQARTLYMDGGAYSLSMYCAGLAVESLLRAFRWKLDPSFEGRHDLSELVKASRFYRIDEEDARGKGATDELIEKSGFELRQALNVVIALWHNNMRFASEASLKAHLNRIGRLQGVKGDPLKKNGLDMIRAAQKVINRGMAIWNSKRRP